MNLQELYDFSNDINEWDKFEDAWSELEDVASENGVNVEDLEWSDNNTTHVEFVYDYLEANIEDFEKKWNDWLVKNTVGKQVG